MQISAAQPRRMVDVTVQLSMHGLRVQGVLITGVRCMQRMRNEARTVITVDGASTSPLGMESDCTSDWSLVGRGLRHDGHGLEGVVHRGTAIGVRSGRWRPSSALPSKTEMSALFHIHFDSNIRVASDLCTFFLTHTAGNDSYKRCPLCHAEFLPPSTGCTKCSTCH